MSGEAEEALSIPRLRVKEVYLYRLPPATSYGHRAELWNVEQWFKAVSLVLVEERHDMYVRLEDGGELFAECPLPSDGTPLTRVVEPVVDSSRYFVLRVAQRQDPKQHAFLGLGFRERGEASDFAAALDDYRLTVRREQEAQARRACFEACPAASPGPATAGDPGAALPQSAAAAAAAQQQRQAVQPPPGA
ncbi:hypothetical protein V8C86DRAFT_230378 [Haematococcus lacustris]